MNKTFPVMLVDDDDAIFTIIQRAAKSSFPEASFTRMSSATEAEDYFDSPAGVLPRLVLVDIDLGGPLNGLDLILYVRANKRTFLMPVVVLTGTDGAETVQEAYQLGASTFTIKPADYTAWKAYLALLREYWFKTVSLPPYPYHP